MAPDVVAIGAATVDANYVVSNLPEPDGGAFAREVTDFFGGVGANVAVGCDRLGRDVGLIARLGEDDVGRRVAADLSDSGVDDSRVRTKPGTSTHTVVLRDDSGERMIVTAGDSTKRLRLDEEDLSTLRSADAVFFTAYVPDAVSRRLLAERESLPPLFFDLSGPVEELAGRGTERETIDRLCGAVEYFVAGEVAAESYLGVDADDAVSELRARGVERGAVTRGEDGATLFSGEESVSVPAFDVDVADATGAGDAFNAGLLDAWVLGGEEMENAGRWAAAVAACNCRSEGAREGMPTRDEAAQLL